MASITIRRLEDAVKERLRVRASRHGRSMEEEAREILKVALADKGGSGGNLAQSIRRRFAPLGGVELSLPPREPVREPPSWTNDPFGYAAWAKKADQEVRPTGATAEPPPLPRAPAAAPSRYLPGSWAG